MRTMVPLKHHKKVKDQLHPIRNADYEEVKLAIQ
jgi:hypothetical protein